MSSLEELRRVRISKLNSLKDKGVYPYPARVRKDYPNSFVHEYFDSLATATEPVFLAGRIKAIRRHGGSAFVDLEDNTGAVQIFLQENRLGADNYKIFEDNADIGDWAEVSGRLFKTNQNAKTLEVASFKIIAKALRPLPEEWFGLKDVEERLRHRYLDLIFNKGIKEIFRSRSHIIAEIRKFLFKQGFMEVETPILQPLAGGALARPFKTHLNSLDLDMYLRVAPELYLKRLLVGGFEKVFELGRCFRNEGVGPQHNPEFTMLEVYWAYHDYKAMMGLTKKLLSKWIKGKWAVKDFSKIFKSLTGKKYTEINPDDLDDFYKKEVRSKIEGPVFLTHYPEAIMPLAKLKEDDQKLTESFQLIFKGTELAKGYSEMNDPLAQREQMERQEQFFRSGNEEASRLDEDFLEALEYGMPPAAGLGIGLDRLVAVATGEHNIRDVILFPLLRPK